MGLSSFPDPFRQVVPALQDVTTEASVQRCTSRESDMFIACSFGVECLRYNILDGCMICRRYKVAGILRSHTKSNPVAADCDSARHCSNRNRTILRIELDDRPTETVGLCIGQVNPLEQMQRQDQCRGMGYSTVVKANRLGLRRGFSFSLRGPEGQSVALIGRARLQPLSRPSGNTNGPIRPTSSHSRRSSAGFGGQFPS